MYEPDIEKNQAPLTAPPEKLQVTSSKRVNGLCNSKFTDVLVDFRLLLSRLSTRVRLCVVVDGRDRLSFCLGCGTSSSPLMVSIKMLTACEGSRVSSDEVQVL